MWRQVAVAVLAIIAAIAIELTILARLDFPGATPPLLIVVVCALAMSMGPIPGAVIGFFAGLAMDLAPPNDGLLGLNGLICLVIGFSVGYMFYAAERPVLLTLGVVALAAGAAPLAYAAIASLLGSTRVIWESVPAMVVASMLYALILTPLVVPGLSWLVQKAGAERTL